MSTSDIAQKSGTLPLERKGSPAQNPVDKSVEQIEGIDRKGFFDENPVEKVFDANDGGRLIFNQTKIEVNPDRIVTPEFQSTIFKDGGYVILGAAQKGAGAIREIVNEAPVAMFDLVKTDLMFKAPTEEQKPNKSPEEIQTIQEGQFVHQQQEDTEAKILRLRRELDDKARTEPLRKEVSDATGIQPWLADIVNEKGEVRTDLVAPVEQTRREAVRRFAATAKGMIANPAKHGAKGPGMINEDNKSGERQGFTAQTATG